MITLDPIVNPSFAEDTSYTVTAADLLVGYTNPGGVPLAVADVTVSNGTGTVVPNYALDGVTVVSYTITPNPDFWGSLSVSMTVNDGFNPPEPWTQYYDVTPVNDAPTGTATALLPAGTEDTAYTVTAAQLLQGFSDIDSAALSVVGLAASNGSVVDNGNGSFTITPVANFNGQMTLNYSVSDGQASAAASQSYAVSAVNDGPTGSSTTSLGPGLVGQAYTVTAAELLAGFSDPDGDTLQIANLTVANGSMVLNADGASWTITPASAGWVQLGYEVSDGQSSLGVTQGFSAVADDLQANADTLLLTRDLASLLDAEVLLANDTVNPVAALSVTSVANAVGGSVALVDGKLVITATAETGSFDYVVEAATGSVRTGHVEFSSVVTTNRANNITAGAVAAADLQGRGGNDRLTGADGADRLLGNGGDDRLVGLAGDDRLNGGNGNDVMIGGSGNDEYVVDSGRDVVTELAGEGVDTVFSSVSHSLGANVENLRLAPGTLSINGTGNDLDNTLTGNAAANVLDGRAGADLLIGNGGHDTYVIDNVGDVIVEDANGGIDTVRTTLNEFTLAPEVENLVFTGTGAATLTGNDAANQITGGSGRDLLDGGAGRDDLNGGAGNDVLIGGAGDDVLNGGMGADVFRFESLADFETGTRVMETIEDFRRGQYDQIDLSAIDANVLVDGDQAFSFIGKSGFSQTAGELRYSVSKSGATVSGDVDGDGAADFSILLSGVSSLGSVDFAT